MKYSEIINSLHEKKYTSVFTEAQRFISKSIKFKNINNLNLEQITKLDFENLYKGKKVKFENKDIYIHKVDSSSISIIYESNKNIFEKIFSIKKNKIIYEEKIKFNEAPWGIRRVVLKWNLSKQMKVSKNNILKILHVSD